MGNLFSGLDAFGLGKLEEMNVFPEEEAAKKEAAKSVEEKQLAEADYLFDKTYTCPVCDEDFQSKMVRTGKVKLLSADTDLRPRYQLVDSLKYDALLCPCCGYAALSRFFNYMLPAQAKAIKDNISINFRGIEIKGDIYTYDEAIDRHKLALVNTIVKKSKNSERAYTCLKLAWLYRGKAETLPEDTENKDNVEKELYQAELELIQNAFDGFNSAFSKEDFPMCGMDENTMMYLCGDLARRLSKFEESSRWISRVLISKGANDRIKNKARDLKEKIKNGDCM